MEIYSKNGIEFVTGLTWQKNTENNKVNLKKLRKYCKFDYYCKHSSGIYGLLKTEKTKLNKPISLALYILNSLEINSNESVFLCFNFYEKDNNNKDLYGYILFVRGSILPEDGEFIGTEDEVVSKIQMLAKRFNVRYARIPDDVPFGINPNFLYVTGLQVITMQSFYEYSDDGVVQKYIPASQYNFWNKSKEYIPKAKLNSFQTLERTLKLQIFAIIFIGILILAFMFKNYYFQDEEILPAVVVKKDIINVVDPLIMINTCLQDIDNKLIASEDWELSKFKCDLKGYQVSYIGKNGSRQELMQTISESDIRFTENGAEFHKKLNMVLHKTDQNVRISNQIDSLQEVANKLNLKIIVSNDNYKKVEIEGNYSPIFLYKNNILTNLNISEISMQAQAGFYLWKISGELNGT